MLSLPVAGGVRSEATRDLLRKSVEAGEKIHRGAYPERTGDS
jgi:hypothetical protein